jgi:hypothetical protein
MKRRDFLKRLGIGAGALALVQLGRHSPPIDPLPKELSHDEFIEAMETPVKPFEGYDIDWDWADVIQQEPQPDLIIGSQEMFDHYKDIYPQTYDWTDTGSYYMKDYPLVTLTDENTIWDGQSFTINHDLQLSSMTREESTAETARQIQQQMNDAANAMVDNINQDIYFQNGYASEQGLINDPLFSDIYREWRLVWDDETS